MHSQKGWCPPLYIAPSRSFPCSQSFAAMFFRAKVGSGLRVDEKTLYGLSTYHRLCEFQERGETGSSVPVVANIE